MRNKAPSEHNENQELADYEQCLSWFEGCKQGFLTWYERRSDVGKDERKVRTVYSQSNKCASPTSPED